MKKVSNNTKILLLINHTTLLHGGYMLFFDLVDIPH